MMDCEKCGACCVAFNGEPYRALVSDIEKDKIPEFAKKWIFHSSEAGDAIRTKINADGLSVCRALDGVVGQSVQCVVYETRPMTCRQFTEESKNCHKNRSLAGID